MSDDAIIAPCTGTFAEMVEAAQEAGVLQKAGITGGPKVVQFPTPDYRDPAKALRNLADDIEAGNYGDVGSCGVVVFGDTMEVFGSGIDSDGPTIALLFSAAAHRFAREIEDHGR